VTDKDPPGPVTVREGAAVLASEQHGVPFLLRRDEAGELVIDTLPEDVSSVTLGRSADIRLGNDPTVSRIHAELARVGDVWVVVDDGLSTNGVFVNGERVGSRRRLRDGDVLRAGSSVILFRSPESGDEATELDARGGFVPVTPSQRAVLQALCRPVLRDPRSGLPAGNQEIADELVLSVDAVKGHLRNLYLRFDLTGDSPARKRIMLAREAIRLGLGGDERGR
jgi:DNA-binding CsgD family transcriptional regulator